MIFDNSPQSHRLGRCTFDLQEQTLSQAPSTHASRLHPLHDLQRRGQVFQLPFRPIGIDELFHGKLEVSIGVEVVDHSVSRSPLALAEIVECELVVEMVGERL